MQTVKTILILLTCLISLTACGLKGPLYLPDESASAPTGNQQEPDTEETEPEKEAKKKDSGSGK